MKIKDSHILIVDDDRDILETAELYLKHHFSGITTETEPDNIPQRVKEVDFDLILLDMNFRKGEMEGKEGLKWLSWIKKSDPDLPVIMITAYGDVGLAVDAIKEGATDFVLKPWKNEKLLGTVHSAIELRRSKQQISRLKGTQKQLSDELDRRYHDMIGESPSMKRVFDLIEKVAVTDANVLILGENGTGKELVSRALHRLSDRKDEVFIRVDLGAISETLFESELFGHVKGSFTDAKTDRAGSFELASGGTIFLDEIGNLPMALQSKLLTVLQQREVKRVGSNKSIPVDVRLICATNMPLYEMVKGSEGKRSEFRQDLLYRINTVEILVPALRDRIEDIPLILNHFLKIYGKKYKKEDVTVSSQVLKKIQKYQWPGNVRELQHAVEKAVILSETNVIKNADYFISKESETLKPDVSSELPKTLEEMEGTMIRNSLKSNRGNMSKVAEELGITRATLYRKIEKYEI